MTCEYPPPISSNCFGEALPTTADQPLEAEIHAQVFDFFDPVGTEALIVDAQQQLCQADTDNPLDQQAAQRAGEILDYALARTQDGTIALTRRSRAVMATHYGDKLAHAPSLRTFIDGADSAKEWLGTERAARAFSEWRGRWTKQRTQTWAEEKATEMALPIERGLPEFCSRIELELPTAHITYPDFASLLDDLRTFFCLPSGLVLDDNTLTKSFYTTHGILSYRALDACSAGLREWAEDDSRLEPFFFNRVISQRYGFTVCKVKSGYSLSIPSNANNIVNDTDHIARLAAATGRELGYDDGSITMKWYAAPPEKLTPGTQKTTEVRPRFTAEIPIAAGKILNYMQGLFGLDDTLVASMAPLVATADPERRFAHARLDSGHTVSVGVSSNTISDNRRIDPRAGTIVCRQPVGIDFGGMPRLLLPSLEFSLKATLLPVQREWTRRAQVCKGLTDSQTRLETPYGYAQGDSLFLKRSDQTHTPPA